LFHKALLRERRVEMLLMHCNVETVIDLFGRVNLVGGVPTKEK